MDKHAMALSLSRLGGEMLQMGMRDEARQIFELGVDLAGGPAESICKLLGLLWENGPQGRFLSAYRRYRPFIGYDQGEPFDKAVAGLTSQWPQMEDMEQRRELGLILFQQGDARAAAALQSLVRPQGSDPMAVRALASIDFFQGRPPADAQALSQAVSPAELEEMRTCLGEQISPTLVRNLDVLGCVVCGGSLNLAPDRQSLSCPGCGKVYPVTRGVPLLLAKPLDEYRDIEPQYWKTFAPENIRIHTFPGLGGLWIVANMPWPLDAGEDPITLLKHIHHTEPHWLNLLEFFTRYAAGSGRARILDVGSGAGHDVYALSRLFPEFDYFGMDVVFPGCHTCQKFKGFQPNQFICADAEARYPFADNSMDIVISHNAIEHCGAAMMAEVHRILRPGGKAFIAGPSEKSYIFASLKSLEVYVNVMNDPNAMFRSHGLTAEQYMEAFRDFRIIKHDSDNFFYRLLLENEGLNNLRPEAVREIFNEFCGVLGNALNQTPDARWYNYIQMFTLEKPA